MKFKQLICRHTYTYEKIRNMCCRGGFYEKYVCPKCGKTKIYYW